MASCLCGGSVVNLWQKSIHMSTKQCLMEDPTAKEQSRPFKLPIKRNLEKIESLIPASSLAQRLKSNPTSRAPGALNWSYTRLQRGNLNSPVEWLPFCLGEGRKEIKALFISTWNFIIKMCFQNYCGKDYWKKKKCFVSPTCSIPLHLP